MRSSTPKVLHEVAGRSMLAHVLAAVDESRRRRARAGGRSGPGRRRGRGAQSRAWREIFVQTERLGTAHAVLAARDALERGWD